MRLALQLSLLSLLVRIVTWLHGEMPEIEEG